MNKGVFQAEVAHVEENSKAFHVGGEVILCLHLLEGTPVSDLCDKHGIGPSMFYRWQKDFFESGTAALEHRARKPRDDKNRKIALLEQKLQCKHKMLSELIEEHVKLKKEFREL